MNYVARLKKHVLTAQMASEYAIRADRKTNRKQNVKCESIYSVTKHINFAALDCETDPFERGRIVAPFAWGLLTDSSYTSFWGVGREEEVANAIANLPPDTIVYAHNGGKFDAYFLAPYFDPGELFIINSRIGSVRIGGRELRDSWLLIPAKLEESGMKGKADFSLHEASVRENHKTEILEYLRQDCVALYALVQAFYAEHGESLTLAGASVKAWQRLTHSPRPRIPLAVDTQLRRHYFGGRCQAFATGILPGPWRVYDMNSAYPWAMLSPHPSGIPIALKSLPRDDKTAETLVKFEGRSRGVLPRRSDSGSLEFPDESGVWRTTGHELIAGLETGDIEISRILLVWQFPELLDFAPFVHHYWNERNRLRDSGDEIGQLVAKFTLNSLYGKLGQTVESRRKVAITRSDDATRWLKDGYEIEGTLGPWIVVGKPNPSPWALLNVGAAASITGKVRAQLWRAIRAATSPIYCDTDSVICRELPLPNRGSALGDWKLEATIPRQLAIAAKKLYAGLTDGAEQRDRKPAWKMASKGVILPPETIVSVARGVPARWESDAPSFTVSRGVHFLHRTVKKAK